MWDEKNLVREDKYTNILVIGVEYETKLSGDIKIVLDGNIGKHDYKYAGKKNNTLYCNSKIFREAIRRYYVKSVLKPVSVSSIGWSELGAEHWKFKIAPKPKIES